MCTLVIPSFAKRANPFLRIFLSIFRSLSSGSGDGSDISTENYDMSVLENPNDYEIFEMISGTVDEQKPYIEFGVMLSESQC